MHQSRNSLAKNVRTEAAELAARRPPVKHCNNNEEYEYRDVSLEGTPPATHLANFTKGLPHDLETGLILNPVDYKLFVNGIQSGDPIDFEKTPLGPGLLDSGESTTIPDTPTEEAITSNVFDRRPFWQSKLAQEQTHGNADKREFGARVRAWESAGAGNVLDLEGPDAQAVTMPAAPRLDSDELLAEMVEVYAMALLRDCPFADFPLPKGATVKSGRGNSDNSKSNYSSKSREFNDALGLLCELPWFADDADARGYGSEEIRRRRSLDTVDQLFRGVTPGERTGPYLSQFMLLGDPALGGGQTPTDGFIRYGAIGIQQKVRVAKPGEDFMTCWEQFIDVQNGADLRGLENYTSTSETDDGHRFIATPRDLATYVHYDALYEAYLNACLSLLAMNAPFDRGIPFLEQDTFDKQQGFAHFGGPHILTLVCEAATRALKAVRYQKFNIHRRLRPEAVGGLIDRWKQNIVLDDDNKTKLNEGPLRPLRQLMAGDEYTYGLEELEWGGTAFLDRIKAHNAEVNKTCHGNENLKSKDSYLLPMAFPEGSPMHPAYGAGHGTVAGACVTILKAYFDHGWTAPTWLENGQAVAYQPSRDGSKLVQLELDAPLTVEGELNKLAANIAIGRNWAGVHYYSDYIESIRLGEEIAIGILEEQKLTYPENFTMTVPLYDGGAIRI